MKLRNFFLVLLVLSTNLKGFGCWFYPEGEDVRFRFLDLNAFGYGGYRVFDYSSHMFGYQPYPEDTTHVETSPNEKLWMAYCKDKVAASDVRKVLNDSLTPDFFSGKTPYTMVKYLRSQNDAEALQYLEFAKSCEKLTSYSDNGWEKQAAPADELYAKKIAEGLKKLESAKNPNISRRYAFLAIRLSFYRGDADGVTMLFKKYFSKVPKDTVYYWAFYFDSLMIGNPALRNFTFAQIFAHSPDKREATYFSHDKKVRISEVLTHANTNAEKANVLAFYATFKSDPILTDLQRIHALDPKSEWLGFLLLREMNKLEDWIFTPYYSAFVPSTHSVDYDSPESNSAVILRRSERDRKYAKRLLGFVESANKSKVADSRLWTISQAELYFMCRDYGSSISTVDGLLSRKMPDDKVKNQALAIKALALTARQHYGNAVILPEVKATLLANDANSDFVFAIGKELERKGNFADAALLYSTLYSEDYDFWDNGIYWRQENSKAKDFYSDYYYDYFDYLNIVSTPEQLALLVKKTEDFQRAETVSEFDKWIYRRSASDIFFLKDLLGTKYMRRNDLSNAMNVFGQIPQKYWNDNYSLWERNGRVTQYSEGQNIFDGNPFFGLKRTPDFMPKKNSVRMDKASLLRQLLSYISKAENPNEPDRDYYAFLVANCYYNMTYYGNSWMMNRFNLSVSLTSEPNVEGDRAYRGCTYAREKYLKAYALAKDHKFRMLCLRMAATCEERLKSYDLQSDEKAHAAWLNSDSRSTNPFYKELYERYPDDYYKLESSCDFFPEYFRERAKSL